jgi:hypothetical protein
MDIYKELNLKPIRKEPDIWVSRLVIYEQIVPEPLIIRDIPLSRGLNIIWAEEAEDDFPAAEITGHSAGKTTFCRLLRYVLGEKTFGNEVNTGLFQNSLPNGYVAAEIHVHAQKWSVIRPIGKGRNSYIKADATIEELLQDRTHPAYLDNYARDIGIEKLLDKLETGEIAQTGETIQWGHVLAWCTRDQECRFQNIHEWRSPRSESDSPTFRFSKAGPLFVMRTLLGLFLPNELRGEEKLAEIIRRRDEVGKELEDKKREPQFRVNLYEKQLRERLKAIFPDEDDIDARPLRSQELLPEDLSRLTTRATAQIEGLLRELERKRLTIQDGIEDIRVRIRQHEGELSDLDTLLNLNTAAAGEVKGELSQRQEQRKKLEEHKNRLCLLGGVIIGECQHVHNTKNILQMNEFKDAHAMEQAEAMRTELLDKLNIEKARLSVDIDRLHGERQVIDGERATILADIGDKQDKLRDLKRVHEELSVWTQKLNQTGSYDELDNLQKQLEDMGREKTNIENALAKLIHEHDYNRELLASIFSGAVRSVLSSGNYDGIVNLEKRELDFHITHGPAMSGEAVETLSVILADIASLIYNTVNDRAHIPGFLLHDSPREADLGKRIYSTFIRFAASLQEHFGGPDKCPFQYILTTTTPPPSELQNEQFVKLQLNAAEPSGLLLGRNIASTTQNNMLKF